jgi:hypothetical protein
MKAGDRVLTSATGGREPITPPGIDIWTLVPSQGRKRVCETRILKAGRFTRVYSPPEKVLSTILELYWSCLETRGPGKYQRQKVLKSLVQ